MKQGIILVVSPLGKSEGYGPLARQITDVPPMKGLFAKNNVLSYRKCLGNIKSVYFS